MTIGIPTLTSFQSSTVLDYATTFAILLENCEAPVFDKGLKIKAGEWVFEYDDDINFIPRVWSLADENKGVYQLDEIILKDCKLVKVVGRQGSGIVKHHRPKEPEQYEYHDTDMNYHTWLHRYVKITANIRSNWLERVWTYQDRQYTINFNTGKHVWYTKDLLTSDGNPNVCNPLQVSQKYDASTDVMARVITWGVTGHTSQKTLQVNSMIERDGAFYIRTNLNVPLEYETWTTGSSFKYSYGEVNSPADINGFIKLDRLNALAPFDGKNYTKTVFDTTNTGGEAKWVLYANDEFDSIAFGRVVADSLDLVVTDQTGQNILFDISNYQIDNTIVEGRSETFPTTVILYTLDTMPSGSIITIMLKGAVVELGEVVTASELRAGFTNLAFKNKFRDFSPKEQDKWGNYFYRDGIKIHTHVGSVDFPIVSYDMMCRLMIYIGGQKVIINSSDSINNELPDGHNIFSATMLIGRFTSFELATSEKNKLIGDIAKYNFAVEELV